MPTYTGSPTPAPAGPVGFDAVGAGATVGAPGAADRGGVGNGSRGLPGAASDAATGTVVDDRINVSAFTVPKQRIPFTIDPLGTADEALESLIAPARVAAISNLYLGMQEVRTGLKELVTTLTIPNAPSQLIGTLLQPDASQAGYMQVQFNPQSLGSSAPKVTVRSDASGGFTLALPAGMQMPATSTLSLTIRGANNSVAVNIPASQVASNGLVGDILLPQYLTPLPVSVLASLEAIAAPSSVTTAPAPLANPAQLPCVKIGDGNGCLVSYGMNNSVDRFPFGVFYRLVEPRASVLTQVRPRGINPGLYTFLPSYAATSAMMANAQPARLPPVPGFPSASTAGATRPGVLPAIPPAGPEQVSYVDRVPVEQPISIDGFRDQIMGLKPDGTFTADELRPMAGTLGLGYVLWMAQRWTLQGLALGDLVYSLPLAPGEQQQVAVFERTDTARVAESEFFTEDQTLQQSALADTSTNATFNSAFNESINGRSSFRTDSDSSSWGANLIHIAGGSGSSSSSGTSSQSLEGQRNTSQQAAQTTHSAAENQAAARRTAARTGMRIATASESEQLTTKVITNHNHNHALTVQYWEVQRLYDVTSGIEGLTLCVLIPLQVVRFMPPGQPAKLSDPSQVNSRGKVLARYESVIKHGDVLLQALPRGYRRGLTMLLQFAADPTSNVEAFGGVAEDVIQFNVTGTFLSCEDIYITAVTERGTRVGPARLNNTASPIPQDQFASREQLLEWLLKQRQQAGGAAVTFTGALALPPTMNRSNIRGFEISRGFRRVDYTLISPATEQIAKLQAMFGGTTNWLQQALESTLTASTVRTTVQLTPADLENALGGPQVYNFSAAIEEIDSNGDVITQEQYANDVMNGLELPVQPYPVPARQLAPVLRYNEILEIEKMAEHVVRRTLHYSHAIWASMSAEERAILLEAYTIGVPPGGVPDATQMVPLLNCVENRVIGFFGNSMIMPFIIPESLAKDGADGEEIHPAKIQEALLAYQKTNFTPPRSIIALPTRGVLGEAVLGHCSSAEKIDLTRFWNWQDSPADTAPAIAASTLPTTTPSLAAGLTAPSGLTNLPSLINNVLTAPAPDTSLLAALSKDAASQKDFDSSLTGATALAGLIQNAQNTANLARQDALKTTKDLSAQSMATVGNILGGLYAGNPTAGSSAAAAVNGKDTPSGGGTPAPSGQGGGKTGTPAPGGTGSGTPGPGSSGTGTTGTGTTGTGTTGTGTGTGTTGGTSGPGPSGSGSGGTSGGPSSGPPGPPGPPS
jgi:hypothetical protein